ncbi:MAG: glycosyl hydrolase, partial [Clostridia bacterium]|nr:glycosyl hydrolase [Clostridia bacterium]
SANDEPLYVQGEAVLGDQIRFVYRPYRLELYRNDVLIDEEWPFGTPYFTLGTLVHSVSTLSLAPLPETEPEPDVTGSFTGAEGWMPGGDVFVGDCMPFSHGDRYHVLYLKDRHHHHSKWGKGAHQWEHISTADLVHWDKHPMAVAIDDPMEGSICTGSWIYANGLHQLYYTVRMADGSSAPIRRSVSEDGFHYRKDTAFGFTLSDAYTGASARDPKIVQGEDGLMHIFVTTTQKSTGKGCLVHLTSPDGEKWTELEPIYIAPDAAEPECSDYLALNGKYYLIFSLHGQGQYRISDTPFTGWREPKNPVIPCRSVPKAAVWRDRVIFAGFAGIDGYAGTMTFLEAVPGEDGEFSYKPVEEMK